MDERIRKPQDDKYWPPSLSLDDIELAIDAVCGCAGRHDCNCISVFNRARSEAWYRHNSKRAA